MKRKVCGKYLASQGHRLETVQKYAQKENWNEDNLPDTEPTSYPVLGEFIPIVDGWLEADRKVPRKQRHTAWRLFCRLRDEYGFRGSYSSVKRYVRKKKYVMKVQSAGFLPLERTPGCGQVDFGEFLYYDAGGQEQKGYALTISFPHSNMGYTQAFPSQNQECLLEGMKRIFEHMGGVPPRLRFDNMTTAVAQSCEAQSDLSQRVLAVLCCTTVSRPSSVIRPLATRRAMWRTRLGTAAEMPLCRFPLLLPLRNLMRNTCGDGAKRCPA